MVGVWNQQPRVGKAATPVGLHIGAGAFAIVTAVAVAAILPVSEGEWRLVPVATMLLIVGVYTVDPVAVTVVALLAYLLVTGFLVNRFAILSWHGLSDMYRLAEIVASAGVGLFMGTAGRWRERLRPLVAPPGWDAEVPADPRALTSTYKEEIPGG